MKTTTFTVNDLGDPEPVIATVPCSRIVIGEDPSVADWPLVDYQILGDYQDSIYIQKPAGTSFEFRAPAIKNNMFKIGDIAGYVKTVSGSSTFYRIEE